MRPTADQGRWREDLLLDPRTYCERAIEDLRSTQRTRFGGLQSNQMVVVLAYFAEIQPEARDFTSQLKLLARTSERSNRWSLAAAAKAVLSDWEAQRGAEHAAVAC